MGSGRSVPAQPVVRGVYTSQVAYPKPPSSQPVQYGGPPAYSAGPAPPSAQPPPIGQGGPVAYGGQGQTQLGQPYVGAQIQIGQVQPIGQGGPVAYGGQGQAQLGQPYVGPQIQIGQVQQNLDNPPPYDVKHNGGVLQAQQQPPPAAATAPAAAAATAPAAAAATAPTQQIGNGEGTGVVSEQSVAKYIELDREIRALEQTDVEAMYQLKQQDLARLSAAAIALQQKVNDANTKCANEKADVDTLANGNASAAYARGLSDISKEQQELVAALTELDMANRELDNTQQALNAVKAELGPLKDVYMKILDLKDKQENVLNEIFKGSYGSIKENKLEKEVDFHWERQQRIKVASSKWLSSRAYIMEACNQLSAGCRLWTEIPTTPGGNGDMAKVIVATRARNNFLAAIQNCSNAQSYLPKISFPYCHPKDLATLYLAVKNGFLDMRTPERHHQVYNGCYLAMYNRAVGLLRWFDQVISGTIEKDYKDATAVVTRKMGELRNERVRLMIESLQRQGYTGPLPELTPDDPPVTSPVTSELPAMPSAVTRPAMVRDENDKPVVTPQADLDSAPPNLPAPTPAAAATSEGLASAPPPTVGGGGEGEDAQAPGGGPIPLDKLAPPPSKEDLFGDVQELFTKHAEEMKELERINDVNKARQEQDLADKLASRRSRKMRKMEELQTNAAV